MLLGCALQSRRACQTWTAALFWPPRQYYNSGYDEMAAQGDAHKGEISTMCPGSFHRAARSGKRPIQVSVGVLVRAWAPANQRRLISTVQPRPPNLLSSDLRFKPSPRAHNRLRRPLRCAASPEGRPLSRACNATQRWRVVGHLEAVLCARPPRAEVHSMVPAPRRTTR